LDFLPENEADSRSVVAGVILFLQATADVWFLTAFTEEAKIHHLYINKWDSKTHQIFSTEEVEQQETHIEFNIPQVADSKTFPTMYNDQDSVSTFNPKQPYDAVSLQPSMAFTPKVISQTSSTSNVMNFPIPVDIDNNAGDNDSVA
jgi:hypothetical protein